MTQAESHLQYLQSGLGRGGQERWEPERKPPWLALGGGCLRVSRVAVGLAGLLGGGGGSPAIVPGSALGRAAPHPQEPGGFGMSVSSCNRLSWAEVWLPRGGCMAGSTWDGAPTFRAAGKRKADDHLDHRVELPVGWTQCSACGPEGGAGRAKQAAQRRWCLSGRRCGRAFAPAAACGLDGRAYSPRLLERVGDGAAKMPLCAPDPVVGPTCHPPQASGCPLFSPHFSSNSVSLEWDGSVPLGLLPLIKESWRTVWSSPTSSGLSWFIKSTTQGGSRDAGCVVIFHVINKDSFV